MSGRRRLIIWLLLTVSICMLCASSVLSCVNGVRQQRAVRDYTRIAAEKNTDRTARDEIKCARRYNRKLVFSPGEHDESYDSMLSIDNSGMMCILSIPSIHVTVPVYHGTDESALDSGAGHLEGTSLPVGGRGTNSVIMAHTGVPGNRLFTDLHRLEKGDTFTISVLGSRLEYKIDMIRTIDPSDMKYLKSIGERDLCTLITCRPEEMNTTRLLVRGERVYGHGTESSQAQQSDTIRMLIACAAAAVIILAASMLARRRGGNSGAIFALGCVISVVLIIFAAVAFWLAMSAETVVLSASAVIYFVLIKKLTMDA